MIHIFSSTYISNSSQIIGFVSVIVGKNRMVLDLRVMRDEAGIFVALESLYLQEPEDKGQWLLFEAVVGAWPEMEKLIAEVFKA